MTETQKKFLQMSEIYTAQDPNSKDHVTKIMLAKGIIVQMQADLILHEKKNGHSEKTKRQQAMIDLLRIAVDTFYNVSGKHLEIGYILHQYNNVIASNELKIRQQDEIIKKLQQQLDFK
jgi:hypothetical protein